MAEILHDFPVKAPLDQVFAKLVTPEGLDQWWTRRSGGSPLVGSEYTLFFGPDHDWRARVTQCVPNQEFEWQLVQAADDWLGTRVGFRLTASGDRTVVSFWHSGWTGPTAHFRESSCCWAMYLRILRRHIEFGETVPYEQRLEV